MDDFKKFMSKGVNSFTPMPSENPKSQEYPIFASDSHVAVEYAKENLAEHMNHRMGVMDNEITMIRVQIMELGKALNKLSKMITDMHEESRKWHTA